MAKFEYIKLLCGYPPKWDWKKVIWCRFKGIEKGVFETGKFGKKEVYAIDVSEIIDFEFVPGKKLPRVLTLNLEKKYWDQIKSGDKKQEYREIKPYWTKRLF